MLPWGALQGSGKHLSAASCKSEPFSVTGLPPAVILECPRTRPTLRPSRLTAAALCLCHSQRWRRSWVNKAHVGLRAPCCRPQSCPPRQGPPGEQPSTKTPPMCLRRPTAKARERVVCPPHRQCIHTRPPHSTPPQESLGAVASAGSSVAASWELGSPCHPSLSGHGSSRPLAHTGPHRAAALKAPAEPIGTPRCPWGSTVSSEGSPKVGKQGIGSGRA